jgi:lipopolysaccharide transport system permease protein
MKSTALSPTRLTVLEPTRGWRMVPWGELHAYRDLLWLLVWRDIAARYKQTILGPLWFVVQPLVNTLVFSVIFGRVAHLSTAGSPGPLFYMCGLLPWSYFSANFAATAVTLTNNAGLFGKVYFPRLIMPISSILSSTIAFLIQAALFGGFYVAYKLTPSAGAFGLRPSAIFFPLVVAQIAALSLGVGLWLAAITARFRDFTVLSGFIIQLWMYGTPIIYPLSQIPARWQWLAYLNPMTMPTELTRFMLLGTGTVSLPIFAASASLTVLLLGSGLILFNRTEKTFVDII